jgi:hypothetical protein
MGLWLWPGVSQIQGSVDAQASSSVYVLVWVRVIVAMSGAPRLAVDVGSAVAVFDQHAGQRPDRFVELSGLPVAVVRDD